MGYACDSLHLTEIAARVRDPRNDSCSSVLDLLHTGLSDWSVGLYLILFGLVWSVVYESGLQVFDSFWRQQGSDDDDSNNDYP